MTWARPSGPTSSSRIAAEGTIRIARLDPYTSAQIIISHVKDGIGAGKKHRLPQRVIDFIPEHHGTSLVSLFLPSGARHAGASDVVDKDAFRYPGPSRKARNGHYDAGRWRRGNCARQAACHLEEVEQIIAESIEGRIDAGQLDECGLTLTICVTSGELFSMSCAACIIRASLIRRMPCWLSRSLSPYLRRHRSQRNPPSVPPRRNVVDRPPIETREPPVPSEPASDRISVQVDELFLAEVDAADLARVIAIALAVEGRARCRSDLGRHGR